MTPGPALLCVLPPGKYYRRYRQATATCMCSVGCRLLPNYFCPWLTRSKVIWQQETLLFYHIRQVAALNAKLLVDGAFATSILGELEVHLYRGDKVLHPICLPVRTYDLLKIGMTIGTSNLLEK